MRTLELVKTGVGATWAMHQARVLMRHGVDVHVAIPPGPTADGYRAAGATVYHENLSWPTREPRATRAVIARMRSLVEEIKPTIIHSHFVSTTLTMRLALGRKHATPRVFQVPGPLHLENALFRRAEIATASAADSWIGTCRWTCDAYRKSGVEPDRVYYTPYGSVLEQFAPRPPGALRRELGIAPTTKILGMVAYLYAPKRYLGQTRGLKGHEDLIDATALLRRAGREVVVVFVGGPWDGATQYEARVHAYARQRLGPAAIFLGTRRDVPDLFPDFDVSVVPSHSENLGGAVEAQLAERPCVASNVGGLPDLVIDGDTGWLATARDAESFAHAIAEVLDHPAEAALVAARGRAHAMKMMDVRTTGAAVASIYQQILSASLRRGDRT